jgi:hypothetical protein
MRRIVLLALFLAAPRAAFACPVCFGQSDSPAAAAINMGIFVLLGVVGAVLAGFASFMVYLHRRARLFADTPEQAPAPAERLALQGSDPQEGTAVC